jgi:D-3-phosphoglycerate dehydrogenase
MTEEELVHLIPEYDGWIIGDDPATKKVFTAGSMGNLKAVVKWGVGVDNVDFEACKELNIPISNVPNVFGEEVSDIAIGYLICLVRKLHIIDVETKKGGWIKPCGNSLSNKKVCLVGFGDIGRSTARKLLSFNLNVYVSDPAFFRKGDKIYCNYDSNLNISYELNKVNISNLNDAIKDSDFIIITCALNTNTYHLINEKNIRLAKKGVKIINVARGSIINEKDVISLLDEGFIESIGFDVFEDEPLNIKNKLRKFPNNIFGSHNGSNTIEAVNRTSHIAINTISNYLKSNINNNDII